MKRIGDSNCDSRCDFESAKISFTALSKLGRILCEKESISLGVRSMLAIAVERFVRGWELFAQPGWPGFCTQPADTARYGAYGVETISEFAKR